uniref:Uncharacterized protein n=1 Tax=Poecilia latipinna TaxID=48699 RepID=A0A3B3VCM7_9TELE
MLKTIIFIVFPNIATVGFGFIQVILEKLVEAEFSCPCHSSYNHGYGLVFFIAPSLIVFLLMCVISYSLKLWTCPWTWTWTCPWTWTCKSIWEALIIMLVPAVTWLIIVFVDGRYYACAKTNWNGKYELIENAAPQKWCKPSNSSLERDSLTDTQFWYSESQVRKDDIL